MGPGITSDSRLPVKTRTVRSLVEDSPEETQLFDRLNELFEINGLHDVRVDTPLVAFNEISFFTGRCEHDDGNRPQVRVAFDLAQHLHAVNFRHLHIEEDDCRVFERTFGEWPPAKKIIERFYAIAQD